jgi:exosortase E/protease (VPEID-CTERM system)
LRAVSALEPTSPRVTAVEKRERMSLAARTCVVAVVLFAEKFFLNGFVNFRAAQAATGLATAVRLSQHFGFRFAVSFAIALALFIYVRRDAVLAGANEEARAAPVRFRWLALHALLLVPIAAVLYNFYGTHGVHLPFSLLAAAALALTISSVSALVLGVAPWPVWRQGAVAVGNRWLYALGAALAATVAIVLSQQLWVPTAQITFELVQMVLRPFLPTLQADPATRDLFAPHFAVGIDPICSGLEGMGLIIAFCAAWLVFFRDEYRFPRALLLIPVGVAILFALNVLRIAVLVLIGNAGHPAVAVFGFHSQAGWISFNAVACGLVFVSRRSRWLNTAAEERMSSAATASTANPTASYLAPFLLVLAAGMISRATSGRFETWYALRLLAGGAALAASWPRLRTLDWRFSWRAGAAGVAVFALWLVAGHFLLASHGMPAALAAMSASGRALWIAGRVATAVLVVPLAEELAYRGYLLRRLVATDFDSVPFADVGWMPVLVTAVAYGILSGPLWSAGIAAGIVFALLLTRTRRMGEAVAAHAIANALLCAAALLGNQWQLW